MINTYPPTHELHETELQVFNIFCSNYIQQKLYNNNNNIQQK